MAGFILALKHSGTFIITNGIGMLISLLGKLAISVGNTLIGYILVTACHDISRDLSSPIAPLVIIFLMSYVMAALFMSVYSTTSLTILQCLYADVDICDQHNQDKFNQKRRPKEMAGVVTYLRKVR